jgi:DNA-binding MarR family transcriptional regulator
MSTNTFGTIMNLLGASGRIEDRFAGELAAVHGLGLKDALLLLHLDRSTAGRLSRVDLAKRLGASPSTITRLTLPLEKIGLVGREPDPRDARLAYVVLTGAGREAAANVRTTLERRAADLFRAGWADGEIKALSGLLARLAAGQNAELS